MTPHWRATGPSGELLAACLALPDTTRLRRWIDAHGAIEPDGGVIQLLPFACESLLAIAPDAPVSDIARQTVSDIALVTMTRVGRAAAVVQALEQAGVPSLLLKGAALILAAYQRWGVRGLGDVDVLIPAEHLPTAVRVLTDRGWSPDERYPTGRLDALRRVHHGLPFSHGPMHNVDLHWRLFNGAPSSLEARIWSRAETVSTAWGTLRVLDPTMQLLHQCAHAVTPQTTAPRWILDVAALLERSGDRVDWEEVVELAHVAALDARLEEGRAELYRWLPSRLPGTWASRVVRRVPRWQSREVDLFGQIPPYEGVRRLRWHWYQFRRFRHADDASRRRPMPMALATYLTLRYALDLD